MPEPLNGDVQTGAAAAPEPISQPASAAPDISSAASPGSNSITGAASSATPASPPAAESGGFRELLKNYGYDTTQFQSDAAAQHQFMLRLVQQQREIEGFHQQQQQYARQQQLLAQQQQRPAPKTAAELLWKLPEYDPNWVNQMEKDPLTGQMRAAQGAPHDIVDKYHAFHNAQRDNLQKLLRDPEGTLAPFIRQIAQEVAGQQTQQAMGSYQEQVFSQNFVQQNSDWLHQRDPNGSIVGLSPWGQLFAQGVKEAEAKGWGTNDQKDYAMMRVQNAYLAQQVRAQGAQQQAAQVGEQQKQAFLQQAGNVPNVSGSLQAQSGARPMSQNAAAPLKDRLRRNMIAAGLEMDKPLPVGT